MMSRTRTANSGGVPSERARRQMLLSKMKSAASRNAISGSGSTLIEIAYCCAVHSAGALLRLNWLSRHHSNAMLSDRWNISIDTSHWGSCPRPAWAFSVTLFLPRRFAIHFSSLFSVFLWQRRVPMPFCAPKPAFLPDEKTSPLWSLLFSCEAFHFSFIRMPLRASSAAQSLPEWPGTTLAEPPLPPFGRHLPRMAHDLRPDLYQLLP